MDDGPRRGEDSKPWKPLGRPGKAPPPKSTRLNLTALLEKKICTHISAKRYILILHKKIRKNACTDIM